MKAPTNKPLDPKLLPLVDLLARAAYESSKRRENEKPRSLPDRPIETLAIPKRRPAA